MSILEPVSWKDRILSLLLSFAIAVAMVAAILHWCFDALFI